MRLQHVGGSGAQAGFIAPDRKPTLPEGSAQIAKGKLWDEAMRYWGELRSDDGAHFDREIRLDAAKAPAARHLGTSRNR